MAGEHVEHHHHHVVTADSPILLDLLSGSSRKRFETKIYLKIDCYRKVINRFYMVMTI